MGFYERRSNRAALRCTRLENAQRIIDAGVGTGYLLGLVVQQAQNKHQVVAVDLSLQMLENAREYLVKHNLNSKQVEFKQADCKQLPYDDEMFDLYISSYLLDLLAEEELYLALREMERVLEPGGQAVLVTMTTELDEVFWPKRTFYRLMNEFYCFGYRHGRWNRIWKSLCAGYAPHCRPIALGNYLREFPSLVIEYSKVSHVSLFPVRIYYVRKQHV
jgi:ubiquinone/menaquinone biosynthesis C-methylase UbiE